jgi:hypothetical protein
MIEDREPEDLRPSGPIDAPAAGSVRTSIQRWTGTAWQAVQDGALFGRVTVMTDLTAELRAVLDGLGGGDAREGRLSVLVGPPDVEGRGPQDYERVGVRSVTALRTEPGEYGEADGVARLELERPSVHRGILCPGIDVSVLMPDVGSGESGGGGGDGGMPAARPARTMVGTPYLGRLAAVLAERDGHDHHPAGLRPRRLDDDGEDDRDGGSAYERDGRADEWAEVADGLAAEGARTALTDHDLCSPMVPRFGIGNFVCAVFACC